MKRTGVALAVAVLPWLILTCASTSPVPSAIQPSSPPGSTVHTASTATLMPLATHDPSLGFHLLVQVTGSLDHKRPGWQDYLPLSFGASLDRDDLLRAATNAEGIIVCADLSLVDIPPGYEGGPPCPAARALLRRGESAIAEPRRTGPVQTPVPYPYILSPRNTRVQTGHPILSWHASGTVSTTYTVKVGGGILPWQREITSTELIYPSDAPPLDPGTSYNVIVVDSEGDSSIDEKARMDLSFSLSSAGDLENVKILIAKAEGLGLDAQATVLVEAEIYAAYGFRADAISLLEDLTAQNPAPALSRRLGDLYLEVGLFAEAQGALDLALKAYNALGDKDGEADAQIGLAMAYFGNQDGASGKEHLKQARELYGLIGDAAGIAFADQVQAEFGGP